MPEEKERNNIPPYLGNMFSHSSADHTGFIIIKKILIQSKVEMRLNIIGSES